MTSPTLYHNPRCSKSRQALAILESKGITPNIILYLETPPTQKKIQELLKLLACEPRGLMRRNEADYKEQNLKRDDISNAELIKAMAQTPKLIERPIFVNAGKAVIGRPPENVLEIL